MSQICKFHNSDALFYNNAVQSRVDIFAARGTVYKTAPARGNILDPRFSVSFFFLPSPFSTVFRTVRSKRHLIFRYFIADGFALLLAYQGFRFAPPLATNISPLRGLTPA
jgi:hypothetical protein